jgi:hypothetical protein
MENNPRLIISFLATETIRNRNNYTFIIIILYLHCFFILLLPWDELLLIVLVLSILPEHIHERRSTEAQARFHRISW